MTIDAKIFQKSRHHDAFSKNFCVRLARHAIEFRESISRKSQRCLFVDESISVDVAIFLDRHKTNAKKIEKRDRDSSNRHRILCSRDVWFFFALIYCDSQEFDSFTIFFLKSFIIITFYWMIATRIITFVKTFIIFVSFHRFRNKIHDFLFFVAFVVVSLVVSFVVTFAFVVVIVSSTFVVVASSTFVAVVSFAFVVVVFSSTFVDIRRSRFARIRRRRFARIRRHRLVDIRRNRLARIRRSRFVRIRFARHRARNREFRIHLFQKKKDFSTEKKNSNEKKILSEKKVYS